MEKFLNAVQKILMPVANWMNKNRYVCALRDGFVFTLPYTLVGSILISLVNMPFIGQVVPESALTAITNFIMPATVYSNNIIAIFVVIGIAFSLSQYYNIDRTHGAAMALVMFLVNVPFTAETEGGEVLSNVIPISYLGATGMFSAMLLAILGVELYKFAVKKNIMFKMPAMVPESIQKSFSSFIPSGIVMGTALIIRAVFAATSFGTLTDFLFKCLQMPLSGLGTSIGAVLVMGVFMNLCWFFGLHGQTMADCFIGPFMLAAAFENVEALAAGRELPNLINDTFNIAFIQHGYWVSIPVLICIWLFRKRRKDWAQMGKIALVPGLFNIYEPLMFGLPLVLNPFMLIPLLITPLITGGVAYLATITGLIPYTTGVMLPIPTPVGLAGILATNSLMGGLIQILLIPLLTLIWYIFFTVQDKAERANGTYVEEDYDAEN